MTPKFQSMSWYRIAGRGWVAAVPCDVERDRANPGLMGLVEIDGEQFQCIGVERFMPYGPIQPGETIGLLVREHDRPQLPQVKLTEDDFKNEKLSVLTEHIVVTKMFSAGAIEDYDERRDAVTAILEDWRDILDGFYATVHMRVD